MSDTISLEFFNRKFKEVLDDNSRTRADLRTNTESLAALTRSLRRIEISITSMETKFAALREDIFDLVKMELGGSLAHQATTTESYVQGQVNAIHQEFLDIIEEIFSDVDSTQSDPAAVSKSLSQSAAKVVRKRRQALHDDKP